MILHEGSTHYDILEIGPDASPQEIRAAYLRAKAAYKKDSVALYSLFSGDETEDMLTQIEEAYQILSNPEKRREYDKHHGLLTADGETGRSKKIVSIDRVPPMEDMRGESDILIPPTTDFTAPGQTGGNGPLIPDNDSDPFGVPVQRAPAHPPQETRPHRTITASGASVGMKTHAPSPAPRHASHSHSSHGPHRGESFNDGSITQEIAEETEWRGMFLRKVREARGVSIEEMSDYTKVSKTYLFAIEEENFDKLPAAVYLRGFVVQISKYLRLPHDKVAAAYMARHSKHVQEKEKRH